MDERCVLHQWLGKGRAITSSHVVGDDVLKRIHVAFKDKDEQLRVLVAGARVCKACSSQAMRWANKAGAAGQQPRRKREEEDASRALADASKRRRCARELDCQRRGV